MFGLLFTVNCLAVDDATVPLAPGYGKLTYKLANIGSYALPPLGMAADGEVINDRGEKQSLHALYKGKYTLLSFFYSNCGDVNGCPLTSFVFHKLKLLMKKDQVLAKNLQLLSLSFDPTRDTPDVIRQYADNFKYAGSKGTWDFLTTASVDHLSPILQDYNQDIQRDKSVNGEQTNDISHILRVFLIDPQFKIRNIYSVGFLHADLVNNDFKTLLVLDNKEQKSLVTTFKKSLLSKPGDYKEGYEKKSYVTKSLALTERRGQATDLLFIANNPPLGLPKIVTPKNNRLSKAKITLGRKLFFDRRLSLNDTFSCAMCHIPEQGFTSNELSMAVGLEGRSVRRNSPTIYNVAYASKLFHDGREDKLEQQIWGPLLAYNEMANPSIGYVLNKLKKISEYPRLFQQAFDGEGINMDTVSKALANYQRALISADSPFDRWFYDKKTNALGESSQRGYQLFVGKAKCNTCHTVTKTFALFTDNLLHNTGIGYQESMGIRPEKESVVLAPGVVIEVDRALIDSVGEPSPADVGLYEITQNPNDRWKYKTPSLRNISLTAPYMHNGSLRTLKSVVKFYNDGGINNELLDTNISPLNLSEVEVDDLVSFLTSLTGSNVDTIIADAFAAPIGDTVQ